MSENVNTKAATVSRSHDGLVSDAFVAYETVNELGHIGRILGVSKSKPRALEMATKRGWFGGDGRVLLRKVMTVNDQTYVLESGEPFISR